MRIIKNTVHSMKDTDLQPCYGFSPICVIYTHSHEKIRHPLVPSFCLFCIQPQPSFKKKINKHLIQLVFRILGIVSTDIIAVDQASSCRRKVLIHWLTMKPVFLDVPVLKENPFMWKIKNNRVRQYLEIETFFFPFSILSDSKCERE